MIKTFILKRRERTKVLLPERRQVLILFLLSASFILLMPFLNTAMAEGSLVEGRGVWLWHCWEDRTIEGTTYSYQMNADNIVNILKSANMKWIAVKLGDADSLWDNSGVTDAVGWVNDNIDKFHNNGIKVYGWQYIYGNDDYHGISEVSEADVANQILSIDNLDGLIIDAESGLKASNGDAKAEEFFETVRSQHPNAFLAYTSFARPLTHPDFPYKIFHNYTDAFLPQAYWKDRPTSPSNEISIFTDQWEEVQAGWISEGNSDLADVPLNPIGSLNADVPPSEVDEFLNEIYLEDYMSPSFWRYKLVNTEIWDYFFGDRIYAIYEELLGRTPDEEGLSYYRGLLAEGWKIEKIKSAIKKSKEYKKHQIELIYQSLLNRSPDNTGLDYYLGQVLEKGWSFERVRKAIENSLEYKKVRIAEFYQNLFEREADSEGYDYYVGKIKNQDWSLERIKQALKNSEEYRKKSVKRSFQGILDRSPEEEAVDYYASLLKKGWSVEKVKEALRNSEEYRRKEVKAAFQDLLGRSPEATALEYYMDLMDLWASKEDVRRLIKSSGEYNRYQVTLAYQEVLGREPDSSGFSYYVSLMEDKGWTKDRVRETFRNSSEFSSYATDQINSAYQDILDRDPTDEEFVHYFDLMKYEGWLPEEVREDLES